MSTVSIIVAEFLFVVCFVLSIRVKPRTHVPGDEFYEMWAQNPKVAAYFHKCGIDKTFRNAVYPLLFLCGAFAVLAIQGWIGWD